MKSAREMVLKISYGCGCCDGRSREEIDSEIEKYMNKFADAKLEEAAQLVDSKYILPEGVTYLIRALKSHPHPEGTTKGK